MLRLKLKKMLLMLYLINNLDMDTLVIMNYNTGEIDIYTVSDNVFDNLDSWLKEHNYDVDEISYMTTHDLKINIHKCK